MEGKCNHEVLSIPDEGVDLEGINVIELLESLLDLGLVGLDVDDEDEGVVLFNLLHGALGVERVHNDLVLVQAHGMRDGLARVLGRARQLQGLGAVEAGRVPDLLLLVGAGLDGGSALEGQGKEKGKSEQINLHP